MIRWKYISKRWKNYFQWKGYLRYWNKMFSTGQKIRFHWPEWRICFKNTFPLDEKKTGVNVWKIDKRCVARKSLSTNRNAFRNTFPLEGKIKLAVAGLSQNRKKRFPLARKNQFPLAGIRLYFKNWSSRFPQTEQKSRNKRILFQLDRKPVSTSRNGEFV